MSSDQLLPYESQGEAEKEIPPQQDAYERSQMRVLEIDGNFREAHVKRENQRMELRSKAYEHAVAVCLGLALYVGVMVFVIAMGDSGKFSPEAQIAIFATPIVSLAAITIFVLRGVFSGFTEKSFSEDVQMIAGFTNSNGGN